MGRGKLNMELIINQKSRNLTFKKRKESLMKKLHELTTLCDVSACMIIYGPTQESDAVEAEIWPQNPDEIRRIIDIYKTKSKDSAGKSFGLSDFFEERKKKVEEDLEKLRKENVQAKYPTWNEFLSFLNEVELREFAAALNNKVQSVKSRIEFLKQESARLSQFHNYYALNHQEIKPVDMFSMNYNSGCNNIQSASLENQVFYESSSSSSAAAAYGLGNDSMSYQYYAPPLLQHSPPRYIQWPMISAAAPPANLQFPSTENMNYHDDAGQEDLIQYLLQFK